MAGCSLDRRLIARAQPLWKRGVWIVAALTVIASGCGGSGSAGTYMAKTMSVVVLIQWQITPSGKLQGTFNVVGVTGNPPHMRVSSTRTPFTGTIRSGSVALDFRARLAFFSGPVGPPPLASIRGELNGSALTLHIPKYSSASGGYRLTRTDLGAYNDAVASLRRRVHHANVNERNGA